MTRSCLTSPHSHNQEKPRKSSATLNPTICSRQTTKQIRYIQQKSMTNPCMGDGQVDPSKYWPRILVKSLSSCFFSAICNTDFHPSNSNLLIPCDVQLPWILTFFLPSELQNMQSGLKIMWSAEALRRILPERSHVSWEVSAIGFKRSRFIVNLL